MEPVQIQVPRQVPQQTTVMVPQTTTEMVATQVPRQVVQEVVTESIPMTSYQTQQYTTPPRTMAAAPTMAYAAPTTYGGYGGSIVGGSIGGIGGIGSIGGFGGRIF